MTRLFAVLLLAGCGNCSGEAPRERRRRPRAEEGDNAGPKIIRAIVPEGVFGAIAGDVRVDVSGRVRRRDVVEPADAGPPAPAETGDELSIGDVVVVGPEGRAEVRLPEQGRFDVGNESRFGVSPYAMNELSLLRGRMHVSLDAPGQGRRILKVSTPGGYILVQGTDLVIGAADDGSVRVIAVDGPAVVRTASGKTELAAGTVVEIDADGRAGRPAPAPPAADAVSSMDGWVQGKRELVRRALPATLAKLAARIGAEVDSASPAFAKVGARRDANRELLKGLREKRAARAGSAVDSRAAQQALAEASEALVEETDDARAIFARVVGRFDLARVLSPAGPPEIDALGEKVGGVRSEAARLFRRSPRRPRPDLRSGHPRPLAPEEGPVQPLREQPSKASGAAEHGENH